MQKERLPGIRLRTRGRGASGRQMSKTSSANGGGEGGGAGAGVASRLPAARRRQFPHWSALPSPPLSLREVFEPAVERGELVVRYRVRKSYSRRTTEATCK